MIVHSDVSNILSGIKKRQEEESAITDVEKNINLDVGLLTAWDPDSVTVPKAGPARESYFHNLARQNVQAVLNKLYSLESNELLALPETPSTVLPRAKPVPKPKEATKWERFAQKKGIKSKSANNREKMVWDDATRKWVPRYGYQKVRNEEQKDWLIEIPDQADPNVDYFAKKNEDKKERIAKNKFQQLRNVMKSSG